MPSEWRETTLDDIAVFRNGKALSPEFYTPDGLHPVYGSNGQIARTNEVLHNEPVVIIGRVGAFCGCVQAAYEPSWVTDNAVVATTREGVDFRFLYYKLLALDLRQTAIGSAQPLVTQGGLKVVHTLKPPAEDQKAIGRILGTLDDKIELNRKMNETLEQMARAIFKSWFVDFEPFRDKGMADSPLGKIPNGWKVEPIAELADVVGGSTPSTGEPRFWTDGQHCWATPKDLAPLHVPVLLDTERRITDAGVQQISSGLLPVGTVLLSSRAPIGYLVIAETPVAINQGFIAMLPRGAVSSLFLLHWSRHNHEVIVGRANGTTFLEISKSNFRPIPVAAPPTDAMKAFDAHVRPMYNRVVANTRQSRTLAAIRDALLPKLMSGEVKVA
jgi:type I restriction enzyme S subunit